MSSEETIQYRLNQIDSRFDKQDASLSAIHSELSAISASLKVLEATRCPDPGACLRVGAKQEIIFGRLEKLESWKWWITGGIAASWIFIVAIGYAVKEWLVKHLAIL